MKLIKNITMAVIVVCITVGLALVARDIDRQNSGFIVKAEKIWLPIVGYKDIRNNTNERIRIYVDTPDGMFKDDLLTYNGIGECHPGDLIDSKIQLIKHTYNYGGVKYSLVNNNYSSYCNGYNLKDK